VRRFDTPGINVRIVVILQQAKRGHAFGIFPIQMPVPFFPGLQDQVFQVCGRLPPGPAMSDEPADTRFPDGQHIQNHIIGREEKCRVPGIEGTKESFGKGQDPPHLITAFLGTVSSPPFHIRGSAR
jgi:hypothetical protein